MTTDSINMIISRAAMDPEFRSAFFANMDQAVANYDLTPEDRAVLRELTPGKLNTMVLKLQEWGEPPGAASLELLRFLFGEKTGQVIHDKQKTRQSFNRVLIAVSAVVLIAVLVIGALVVLSSGDGGQGTPTTGGETTGGDTTGGSGSTGGGSTSGSADCQCVEDCSGVACVTTCTDSAGNRCVP